MTRLRIYTKNKELVTLCKFADGYFNSYTVYGGGGVWQGKHEPSVTFEVISDLPLDPLLTLAKAFSRDVKAINAQEAVLITHEPIEGVLI